MTEDDNATTAAELPLEEEENGGGGDIEEGKILISENTDDGQRSSSLGAATSHGTSTPTSSTTTTTLPLGGNEDVDEEDAAAPVPSIQQTTDMAIEKDDTNTRNNTVAASEDASMKPQQPPAQDAMEQIEDGDDAAAPRPFNSSDFEDDDDIEPKPEIELCEVESTDEDDGPPLPLSQQRDSLSDAKTMAALSRKSSSNSQNKASDAASSIGGDEWIGGDPIVQQIDQHPSPGDEENVQKRAVGPEENQSASVVDEQERQVVSTAEATAILEAYLVEAERGGSDDGGYGNGNDTVYEATLLEPELPWWKQRRTKVFMAIICVLMTALAASLGVAFSRSSVDITAPAVENAVPPAVAVESSSNNRGEWEQCTVSTQCQNECCSSKYSDDGALKCTPVGGFKPKEGCVGRGEWEQCTDSIQCQNECCSSKYSDDGVLKCTPVGGFKPKEGCVGSSTTTSKLGEWEQCTDSRECENQCCSSMYSEGVLKCTPVGGFKISDGCVGSATRHLRGINNEDEVLTVTDETTLTSKP